MGKIIGQYDLNLNDKTDYKDRIDVSAYDRLSFQWQSNALGSAEIQVYVGINGTSYPTALGSAITSTDTTHIQVDLNVEPYAFARVQLTTALGSDATGRITIYGYNVED